MSLLRVFVGYDDRERAAFDVACASLVKHCSKPLSITAIGIGIAAHNGIYWRPTEYRNGQLYDVISNAPMSTGFAIARFLVPYLSGFDGWALFCDCDFLFRADVSELFALADDRYAVQLVQHNYVTGLNRPKMTGIFQSAYPRKNWSSLVLWNCGHSANTQLSPEYVNAMTGRELHAFSWLPDNLIGALPFEWNWLELEPKAVHFTRGTPDMAGWEGAAYADEWWSYARGGNDAVDTEGRAAPHEAGEHAKETAPVVEDR